MSSALSEYIRNPVEELQLSMRARNCLRAKKLDRIEQLVQLTHSELLRIPNLGMGTLIEIEQALHERGLSLGMLLVDPKASSEPEQGASTLGHESGRAVAAMTEPYVSVVPECQALAFRKYLLLPIDELNLSVRGSNGLLAHGIERLGQLVQLTESDVLKVENLGRLSMREIERALHERGLSLGMSLEGATVSSELDIEMQRWVTVNSGMSIPLAPEQRMLAYLNQLSDRERAIVNQRITASVATLEDIGQLFGVTRERIRQIEARLVRKLCAYVASSAGSAIRRCASEVRADLGAAVPSGRAMEYCRERFTSDIVSGDGLEMVWRFALWVAGPYVERAGWMTVPEYSAEDVIAALCGQADNRGWISPEVASETLAGKGIQSHYHFEWLRSHEFIATGDGWLPKLANIPDRAEQVLRYRGEPVAAEELCLLVGCESERSLRSRLHDDVRFKRTSRHAHFALREWVQYDEYSGIVEEITEEIEKQGGAAMQQHLIEAISTRYGVKPSSVYQYLSAPMFIKDRDGRVRLRTRDEALRVQGDPATCPGLYFVNNQWALRVEINSDTLRGSGRPLQSAVAVLVGCQPGERRVFRSPNDEIVVSWPASSASGPNLGSIKPDVDALSGEVGDFVFLTLGADEIGIRLLRTSELQAISPVARLALLVGLPVSTALDQDLWQMVGAAIGISGRLQSCQADDVHAALMRRNEVSLANLVREACPQSDTNILDQLEDMLGL